MKFQTKILLITLLILILILVMNSVLSLASFEKIYVKSQISTYELICKDIKRKIERSLRFGKPLEKFKNMDILLEDTLKQNPKINNIAITKLNGQILYHQAQGDKDNNIGEKTPKIDDIQLAKTILISQSYHSFLSLHDRSKKTVGIIELTFSRSIVYDKLKDMAKSNLSMLLTLVFLTSVLLPILLAMVIMRPINTQIVKMSNVLRWRERPFVKNSPISGTEENRVIHHKSLRKGIPASINKERITDYLQFSTVKNEIDRLGIDIETFVNSTTNFLDKLDELYLHQNEFIEACNEMGTANAELEKSLLPEEKHHLYQFFEPLRHLIILLRIAGSVTELKTNLEDSIDPKTISGEKPYETGI